MTHIKGHDLKHPMHDVKYCSVQHFNYNGNNIRFICISGYFQYIGMTTKNVEISLNL